MLVEIVAIIILLPCVLVSLVVDMMSNIHNRLYEIQRKDF